MLPLLLLLPFVEAAAALDILYDHYQHYCCCYFQPVAADGSVYYNRSLLWPPIVDLAAEADCGVAKFRGWCYRWQPPLLIAPLSIGGANGSVDENSIHHHGETSMMMMKMTFRG